MIVICTPRVISRKKENRNGAILQEFIKQTNTAIINTSEEHQGTWTRENRRNTREKSVIDHIIVSKPIRHKVIESATDNHNIYKIEGMNPTDHNIITATTNIEVEPTTRVISKWKTGTPEEWRLYNEEIQKKWQQTNPTYRNYSTLQKQITNFLQTAIGTKKVAINRKEKVTNPLIKKRETSSEN